MSEEQLTTFGEEVKAASSFVDDYMRGGRRRGVLCANPNCRWHTEVKGGAFNYSPEQKGFFCEDCFWVAPLDPDCKDRWHFTTTHFNGQPIEVKGAAHLRQLEKQFGVSSHAYNHDSRNWDTPPSVRPQPMNPELQRFLGKAAEMGQRDRGSRVSGSWER